ncbi:MAG: MBL fold metallo-hydrolase [Nitrospinae bacterium]|nr:MBL fold metallo-hydrolase [Nitrospinota bacterium]
MKIKFWGVRGSIPTPGRNTVRYGGNTACIEVRGASNEIIILDAGSGIKLLGESLANESPVEIHLLISHTHWDHINGFPFFVPAYMPNNIIHFYGPGHFNKSLREIIHGQMEYSYFPVRADELRAKIDYRDLKEETIKIGNISIHSKLTNHPVINYGYRLEEDGKAVVYTGDHEKYFNFITNQDQIDEKEEIERIVEEQNNRIIQFVKGADILIADSQYTEDEYVSKKGWGHSAIYQSLELAIKGGVKHLILFHHEPVRTDNEQDRLLNLVCKRYAQLGYSGMKITAAKEGEEIKI